MNDYLLKFATRDELENVVFKDLVCNGTFALFWHTNAEHMSNSWGNVSLTDDTFRLVALLEALTSCDEDWGNGGIVDTFYHWQCIAVETVDAFFEPVEDIAAFWAAGTENHCIFIAHSHNDNAFAVQAIAVKGVDDLAFEFILICWINNTSWVFALEVDVDMTTAGSNSAGLFPVDFFDFVAVFVFLENGETKFFHNCNVAAECVAR